MWVCSLLHSTLMKTQQAIDALGGLSALAATLKVSPSAICQWGQYPPPQRQVQIAQFSNLKAEPDCWERVVGMSESEFAKAVCAKKRKVCK